MPETIALAALIRDGKVLLAHRIPERSWYPDCWDLVGGHVEAGESPETAIRRECREEIDVSIVEMKHVDISVADPTIEPHAFVVTRWLGEPHNAAADEHDALGWFTVADLPDLHLAHPNYETWLPGVMADQTLQPPRSTPS